MSKSRLTAGSRREEGPQVITSLSVEGFKSICERTAVEIGPLTLLAGTNSSGKSSMLQPLLLLKQTLEAPYDPGPLLLNGPNVKFTHLPQLLCRSRNGADEGLFSFGLVLNEETGCTLHFRKGTRSPVEIDRVVIHTGERPEEYRAGATEFLSSPLATRFPLPPDLFGQGVKPQLRLVRNRCFLDAFVGPENDPTASLVLALWSQEFEESITRTIHVPGLRGNPRRNYPVTAVGDRFSGTFEDYVASVVAAEQREANHGFVDQLGLDLRELGLTWKVQAQTVDDTQVELRVGRLPRPVRGGAHDLVSIADVGFGVSQTLPVVVALLVAKPGQLVYIEQPEIHLHPRAQHAMAGLLARAANRGVQVVIETHSSILLLGVQNLVARGDLDPAKVKLHWFQRDEQTGLTNITSADLDEAGSFGAWPEDFDDVTLAAQQAYLDAAEKKLAP